MALISSCNEEYEGDVAIFNDCPGSFTNDQGVMIYEGNKTFPDCITIGATICVNK
jgi:hypothetical protein|tara:strand:+ start:309 stop:473 length:165 start_codon:yes stop_codon:yes gene_type:complete